MSACREKDNSSEIDEKSPGIRGLNFIKPFSGVQKKVTRGKQNHDIHGAGWRLID
jgi:hypothetical protein